MSFISWKSEMRVRITLAFTTRSNEVPASPRITWMLAITWRIWPAKSGAITRPPGMNGVVPETKSRLPTFTPCDSGARGLVSDVGLITLRVDLGVDKGSVDPDVGVFDDFRVLGDFRAHERGELLHPAADAVEAARIERFGERRIGERLVHLGVHAAYRGLGQRGRRDD